MTNFINEKELKDKFVPGQVYDYGYIMRKIETTRVDITFCKDCQFARNNVTSDPDEWCCERSWRGRVKVDATDFCKWGEPV